MNVLTILPLIQMSSVATIGQAGLATAAMMGSLSTLAILAPSEQFLQWGSYMGIGCGAMLGVSIASIMMPQSRALFNMWLWGGLAFGGCMTLYQT
jgi:hypothetical protein